MTEPALIPAATYARMSTEDQKYSIENQISVIQDYARRNGYEIVTNYADPGISGLDLRHRPGLKALLEAVLTQHCAFQTVLVLDVTRWGRFQDVDESAFYEFTCRKAGVRVQYCAEAFVNDLSPYSSLVKVIKRVMAAEYSRELGTKVLRGQVRIASVGFKMGGATPIGLRRLLVDQRGNPKQILRRGERKNIHSDHVKLIPGPLPETRFVRNVYRAFLAGWSIPAIARQLKRRHSFGREWSYSSVNDLLTNPQYIGTNTFNRTTGKLRTQWRPNPKEQWVVATGAIEPIVPKALFDAVQEKMNNYTVRLPNEELLRRLKAFCDVHGYVTATALNKAKTHGLPNACVFRRRFGSLSNAIRLIGFEKNENGWTKRRMLATMRRTQWLALKENLISNGIHLRSLSYYPYHILLSGAPSLEFFLARPMKDKSRGPQWLLQRGKMVPFRSAVIGILSADCKRIIEYVLTGRIRKTPCLKLWLTLPALARLSIARFRDPSEFASVLQKVGYAQLPEEGTSAPFAATQAAQFLAELRASHAHSNNTSAPVKWRG